MEKKIYQENPDGSKITIIEKKGFVFRDGLIAVIGGAAGCFIGGVSVPILNDVIIKALPTAPKMVQKGVVCLSSVVLGEITEHSITRGLNDICEASDEMMYELTKNRMAKNLKDSKEEESSEKTEETKKK